MRITTVLASLALLAVCAHGIGLDEPKYLVQSSISRNPLLLPLLKNLDTRFIKDDLVQMFLSENDRRLLDHAKVSFDILEVAQPLRQKLSQAKKALPTGYSDLDAINAFLEETASSYPNIAKVLDSTEFSVGLTFEGRRLPLIKISGNVSVEEDEPAILINGAHHSREIVTPQLAMEVVRRLTTQYGSDPTITNIVNSNQIIIAPVWNPDGYVYTWEVDNMWRKNRKTNRDGSKGVDQNRNYNMGWSNSCSGSVIPASETYKGPSPASEEETQIMEAISLQYNIAKLIDFHSSGREVLVGYLCQDMPSFFDDYIVSEGEKLADLANYGTRRPSADGEHQEWTIANVTAYAYLIETETEFQPPFQDALNEFERVWPSVLGMFQRSIPLSGHITYRGSPVAASITVLELGTTVTWHSDTRFGRYHIFLPDGAYNLNVFSAGLPAKTVSIRIVNDSPSVLNISLD